MAKSDKVTSIHARRLAPGQNIVRRTKVANGSSLLAPEGNGSGWWARRYGEILGLRIDDLSAGDPTALSESQISLAKRACAMEVELERREAAMSAGGSGDADLVNLKQFAEITGQLVRLLTALGLRRVPRAAERSAIVDHFARPYDKGAA